MISFVVASIVFGLGFVVELLNPSLWWTSMLIGLCGSLVFARLYSRGTKKSFWIHGAGSLLFCLPAYLYVLLLTPHLVFWFAVICSMIVGRWVSLWFAYALDKERYPLLSIPKMSTWFLGLALTLWCAVIWGYRLYFGYSHSLSIGACMLAGVLVGGLLLRSLAVDSSSRKPAIIASVVMFSELIVLTSLFSFVPMVRALITSTIFLLCINLIRVSDRAYDRSAPQFARVALIATVSLGIFLVLLSLG